MARDSFTPLINKYSNWFYDWQNMDLQAISPWSSFPQPNHILDQWSPNSGLLHTRKVLTAPLHHCCSCHLICTDTISVQSVYCPRKLYTQISGQTWLAGVPLCTNWVSGAETVQWIGKRCSQWRGLFPTLDLAHGLLFGESCWTYSMVLR